MSRPVRIIYKASPAMMEKCFGVIADIQHADVEDGCDFRYRILLTTYLSKAPV